MPYPDARSVMAAHMSEEALLQSVRDCALAFKWRVYHTRDSRGSDEGYPDLHLVRNGVQVFAELKTQKGRLSRFQLAWLEDLQDASHEAVLDRGLGTVHTPAAETDWRLADPPMEVRRIRVYVWRPMDWLEGEIERQLR